MSWSDWWAWVCAIGWLIAEHGKRRQRRRAEAAESALQAARTYEKVEGSRFDRDGTLGGLAFQLRCLLCDVLPIGVTYEVVAQRVPELARGHVRVVIQEHGPK